MFKPNFMKIRHLVQLLLVGKTHKHRHINLAFLIKKEKFSKVTKL